MIDKILALLNTEGKTEAEIEQTSKLAAKLMAKHELTMEDLQEAEPELIEGRIVFSRHEWILVHQCCFNIGKLYDCISSYNKVRGNGSTGRSDKKNHYFSGYEPDVEIANGLLKAIVEQGKLGAKAFQTNRSKTVYLRSFGVMVNFRIRQLRTDLEEARTDDRNALVPVKMQKIKEFVGELNKEIHKSYKAKDLEAQNAGYEDGRRAKLRRELDEEKANLLESAK